MVIFCYRISMMNKIHFLPLVALCLALFFAGCSPSTPAAKTTPRIEGPLAALYDEPSGEYLTQFEMFFDGSTPWLYLLKVHSSPPLRETSLHIEGIDPSLNPGDIRLVSDGTTSWMIGPGTENQCFQFPAGQGMDPSFLFPADLLPLGELNGKLPFSGTQDVAGKNLKRYSAQNLTIGKWVITDIKAWQNPSSGVLVGLSLQAAGEDPFFSTGQGKLKAQYALSEPPGEPIQPVTGCEISLPLPETATMFVRLPGLASFESTASVEELTVFYQNWMAQAGWTETAPIEQVDGAVEMSYTNGSEEVTIQIEQAGGKSKVKLVFMNQ
jgi:hypothetical protein